MASTSIDNSPIIRVVQTDSNGNPVYSSSASFTQVVTDTQTLSANNTTAAVPIFGLTGTINIINLYGVVTTPLGSNVTAAAWRLNDQSAQTDITLGTGTTISSAGVGSFIAKLAISTSALTFRNTTAGWVSDGTTNIAHTIIGKKLGAATNIEFVYTTTNTPTSGVIQFFAQYVPLSSDGLLTPL